MRDVIFVSSPVYGIEKYREETRRVLRAIRMMPIKADDILFDFYMYENHFAQGHHDPNKTYTTEIMQHFEACFGETPCSIFFLFFSHRIGNGTREEFEYFRDVFKNKNPNCELWWRRLPANGLAQEADVAAFEDQLYPFNEQMPILSYDVSDPAEFSGWLMMTLLERFKTRNP